MIQNWNFAKITEFKSFVQLIYPYISISSFRVIRFFAVTYWSARHTPIEQQNLLPRVSKKKKVIMVRLSGLLRGCGWLVRGATSSSSSSIISFRRWWDEMCEWEKEKNSSSSSPLSPGVKTWWTGGWKAAARHVNDFLIFIYPSRSLASSESK